METQPLVTFILPVCNNEADLPACLDSLLSQTYQPFEVIAVDDNSKDNSYKLLKQYRAKDKRIKIYRNVKRYGCAMTLNRAVRRAKGTFITFLEPTDRLDPQHTFLQISCMQQYSKVIATTTQCAHNSSSSLGNGILYTTLLANIPPKCYVLTINRLFIPKDLLHFKKGVSPLIYYDVFKGLQKYGDIVRLSQFLHTHTKLLDETSLQQKMVRFGKVLFKSLSLPKYKTPLRPLPTLR